MPYHQRIQIMGVTGDDATFKVYDSGPLSHFSVCVEEWWRVPTTGERKHLKTWFRCSAFWRLAEAAAKILKRGTWVFVEGRIRTRKVGDKEYWTVNVDSFKSLSVRERKHAEPEDENQDNQQED